MFGLKLYGFALMFGFVGAQSLIFTNPIFGGNSPDSSILKLENHYYLTLANGRDIIIYKSPILTNFRNVENSVAYRAPEEYDNVNVSEMIEVNDGLYIYFNMNIKNSGRRLYVIKANNSNNPMGSWSGAIRLLPDWDYVSYDGTVMKHNQRLYFVWTSIVSSYSLYIAPMISPTEIGSTRVLLRQPRENWECDGTHGCISERASFIYNGNRNTSYLIYSSNAWTSPDYCLSQMSIRDGLDPLDVGIWQWLNQPVFQRNDDKDVYATGAAEFTTSPDGTETWMVYHGTMSPTHMGGRRIARIDKIEWNADGSPKFPRPLGNHHARPVPSGQYEICI